MKNCININLKKDEITIRINDKATHEEVMEALKKKMTELKKLYKEEKTPIFVTGKILKNKEIAEIKDYITAQIDVKVKFDSPKSLGLHEIKRVFSKDVSISETKFHHGSLRSGQKMEYEGSIVIIGDVSVGAEVIAGDNVVVVGNLRGLAHAGAKGNKQAIIAASYLSSPQIRISNVVKEMDEEEYANVMISIQNNEIVIE